MYKNNKTTCHAQHIDLAPKVNVALGGQSLKLFATNYDVKLLVNCPNILIDDWTFIIYFSHFVALRYGQQDYKCISVDTYTGVIS
jgi:hypothetical protein